MAIARNFRAAIQLLRSAEILLRSPSVTEAAKKEFVRDLRGFLNKMDEEAEAEIYQLQTLLKRAREFIEKCDLMEVPR